MLRSLVRTIPSACQLVRQLGASPSESSLHKLLILRTFQSSSALNMNVAVVLAGSGVYDGSDIHEASAVLVHLSRARTSVSMFAPDVPQMHTINHLKGEPLEPNRNVLEESARIARGKVQPLTDLDPSKFDAIIVPGGFGVAKNLSTFAVDGPSSKVIADLEKTLKEFHSSKKPIGLCCISPILAARVFPGCEVTLGKDKDEGGRWPNAGAVEAAKTMGAKHVNKDVNEIHVDQKNKIVTTPAFMCETDIHEVYDGIGVMVNKVLSLTGR